MKNKPIPFKHVTIKSPMFSSVLVLCVGEFVKYKKYMLKYIKDWEIPVDSKENLKNLEESGLGFYITGTGIVWLRDANLSILAHELSHFAIDEMRRVGISCESDNGETYAYFFEYFFTQSFHFLNKEYGIKI